MSETTHDLKIWPEHFEAVVSGRKTFEVRADDREYAEGDTLVLREWALDPNDPSLKKGEYTGRVTERRVSHLLRDSAFVRDGFVILSLAPATPPTPDLDAVVARVQEAIAAGFVSWKLNEEDEVAFDRADLRALLAAVSRPAEIVAQDGGSSVPTPEDLAFRRGVYAERAEWRKATGAAHWSEVSRPAEARGEPVAWGLTYSGELLLDAIFRYEGQAVIEVDARNTQTPQYAELRGIVPLYTHPAPSGGEGAQRCPTCGCDGQSVTSHYHAAPRSEPGEPSEAMVEAAIQQIAQLAGFTKKGYANLTERERSDMHYQAEAILRAALAAQRGTP